MSAGKYILVNGSFIPGDEYLISLQEDEAFLFSERIRAIRTRFPFFNETLEIIKLKLEIFNHSFPEFTGKNGAGLKRQLERTLTKNKHFLGAIFTITFRGLNDQVHYTIQSEKYEQTDFELNEKGLFLGVFEGIKKPFSSLSNLSLGSEIYWKIARNYLKNSTIDQLLLQNTQGKLVEGIGSNIYLINGFQVTGLNCEFGAYLDISQEFLFDIFGQLNLKYSEKKELGVDEIRSAEEIMLVNAIEGVRWVVGFEGKRYFNNTIRKINELFAQRALN